MCGIAGFVYKGSLCEVAADTVCRMIALQRHRGPDGEGFYHSAGASLGHCRLAIIDLSDAGHQPMADFEGRCWITFNGEIYNYLELAEELRGKGYRFRGHSDTEVLLAAYRQWGDACVEHLRGMFAFAIWDEKKRRLFAARDRLGIKPFHYWIDGSQKLAFASELKALLELLPERRVNFNLACDFLAWNLLDHEPADTMIEGIMRLPAAHTLTWSLEKGVILHCYWHLNVNQELATSPMRRKVLIDEFRVRFEESIAYHLRSDVPVGTCLSGGLDSSAIVCLVNRELKKQGLWREEWQHTFSACFEEPHLDERLYMNEVIAKTECTAHFIFPSGSQLYEEFDTMLWHQEEPIGSLNVYAQYCVAKLAHEQGIKVLLDGQGADEQLAGYRKFILVYLKQCISEGRYVRAAKEGIAFFLNLEILKTCNLKEGRRYLFKSIAEADQLWGAQKLKRPEGLGLGNSLGDRIEADLTRFSLPQQLRYEDRNTMAFSIESRVPFLDHPLVEWLATLPADMRLSGSWTKRILREGLIDVLPERVRKRKSKLGFSTPESKWIAGSLAGWMKEALSAPRYLADVVDLEGVKQLYARREAGDRSFSLEGILFRLASYETWARKFLGSDFHLPTRDLRDQDFSQDWRKDNSSVVID